MEPRSSSHFAGLNWLKARQLLPKGESQAALRCRGAAKAAALLVILDVAEKLVQLPVGVQQSRRVKPTAGARAALLAQAAHGGLRAHLCVCSCQGLDAALLALKHPGAVQACHGEPHRAASVTHVGPHARSSLMRGSLGADEPLLLH